MTHSVDEIAEMIQYDLVFGAKTCDVAEANLARLGHLIDSMRSKPRFRIAEWLFCDRCGCTAVNLYTEVLGHPPRYFRPPYGHLTTATLREVRRQHLALVLWSIWGKEFAEFEVGPVMSRLEAGLRPGAIVLLHDNDVSCRAGTAALTHAVLPRLRQGLADRGLQAVTVGELVGGPGAPDDRLRDQRVGEAAR